MDTIKNATTDLFGLSVNLTLEIGRFSRLQSTEELIKPFVRDESAQRIAEILGPSEKPADNWEDFVSKIRNKKVYDEILKLAEGNIKS